ncbi:TetR family transcriptional regulator [Amycolatopsis mediterranei S699]|uniref:TetR family transcriptional regulator n=2 Tax=Amycolatopsis mediterranei TaxID=33910 RepID=A0A0H3DA40_AMYMU|nr:TetR/AcrR family transcriptional regulator [Amycolatopsis mediterranei]ADJ47870.1 TetR family transcriptional regulator [Amycolatopsis mediterranei U32]AEK44762.1 TetR family transcriptional regulator [Amycolatopsis mediterranei S699]AFO79582.1 TetR family transcriptional regulator [Amycolatopsis mediterranei S699]AGT86710.1 TetR family transcriptional regulator [Amycolatopsis mediterranei RB]KDO10325.1 TetR family transcriptional regulator [Amycolatopsis mediterranei]
MSGATKQKLFEATLELSKSRGLVGLTVDDIAAAAGVAKGTVYYNFGSKDGLVDALLRYGVDILAGRLRSAVSDGDPLDVIEAQVDTTLEFIARYPGFSQILVSELWRTPGQWHGTLSLLREEIISIVKHQLSRLEEAGRLPEGVEIPTAAAGLFGTMLVVALDWQVFGPQRTRAEVRDAVMVLIRGLGRR